MIPHCVSQIKKDIKMSKVELDDVIALAFERPENGATCGKHELENLYPYLGALLHQAPIGKEGRAAFQVSVVWDGECYSICLTWRARKKVSWFKLTDIQNLWSEIDTRILENRLDWRVSKW